MSLRAGVVIAPVGVRRRPQAGHLHQLDVGQASTLRLHPPSFSAAAVGLDRAEHAYGLHSLPEKRHAMRISVVGQASALRLHQLPPSGAALFVWARQVLRQNLNVHSIPAALAGDSTFISSKAASAVFYFGLDMHLACRASNYCCLKREAVRISAVELNRLTRRLMFYCSKTCKASATLWQVEL